MWCTRWFLPLLLLPLPTAPPYFLALFILSLVMHAKPCFYCIILLTTLFISSCYWQPFPLDSQLSVPWSENITTFADALRSTISPEYTKPLPPVIRAADRCWCDFSTDGFFEPFNVTQWEYTSVMRLKGELEKQNREKKETVQDVNNATLVAPQGEEMTGTPHPPTPNASGIEMPRTLAPSSTPTGPSWGSRYRRLRSFLRSSFVKPKDPPSPVPSVSGSDVPSSTQSASSESGVPPPTPQPLPLLRTEYDLRPYGLGVTIDFGWKRN